MALPLGTVSLLPESASATEMYSQFNSTHNSPIVVAQRREEYRGRDNRGNRDNRGDRYNRSDRYNRTDRYNRGDRYNRYGHRMWVKGHWERNRYGRRIWVPGHWVYRR